MANVNSKPRTPAMDPLISKSEKPTFLDISSSAKPDPVSSLLKS